jgi:hypothetical protein
MMGDDDPEDNGRRRDKKGREVVAKGPGFKL